MVLWHCSFLTLFYGDQNPNTSEMSYLHSAMKDTADRFDKVLALFVIFIIRQSLHAPL
jgi:hypothetical protein